MIWLDLRKKGWYFLGRYGKGEQRRKNPAGRRWEGLKSRCVQTLWLEHLPGGIYERKKHVVFDVDAGRDGESKTLSAKRVGFVGVSMLRSRARRSQRRRLAALAEK